MYVLFKNFKLPKEKINNQAFNVGFENHSVSDLADLVKKNISDDIEIIKTALMIIDPIMFLQKKYQIYLIFNHKKISKMQL